jgi:hypothetical protein
MNRERINSASGYLGMVAALLILALAGAGCGGEVEDGAGVVEQQSGITFANLPGKTSPFLYDSTTQCGGTNGVPKYHCCPKDMAMVGANLSKNIFKCAALDGGFSVYFGGISKAQRNGMLSCPYNQIMRGYSGSQNFVLCGETAIYRDVVGEYIDGGTQDAYPMHVCKEDTANPDRYAMTGIHGSTNTFACSR